MTYVAKLNDYKLIELVRQHRYLYDRNHKDYRDLLKKELTWRKISAVLGYPDDFLRKRFRNLRDRFTKEKRRKDVHNDPTLPFIFKKMLFLADHLKHRQRDSTILPGESTSPKPEEKERIDEGAISYDSDTQDEVSPSVRNKRPLALDRSELSSEANSPGDQPIKKSKSDEDHLITFIPGRKVCGIAKKSDAGDSSLGIPCNDAFAAVVKDYLDQIENPVRLSLLRIQILTTLHNILYSQK